jgi:hypothetical protein
MNNPLHNESRSAREIISEIAKLTNTTHEEVLRKAQSVQHIWRLGTIRDGVIFLLQMTRLEYVISTSGC